MTTQVPLSHADFEQLLANQQQLIELTNDLEYHLYRLGDPDAEERMAACQQAGGAVVGLLRKVLFQQDQQVLPLLESLLESR